MHCLTKRLNNLIKFAIFFILPRGTPETFFLTGANFPLDTAIEKTSAAAVSLVNWKIVLRRPLIGQRSAAVPPPHWPKRHGSVSLVESRGGKGERGKARWPERGGGGLRFICR